MSAANERKKTIEKLHRKFSPVIYDLCVRMLKDRSEAEDAVQETYINAYRSLDSFTYGENHLPWLYRIATNACLKTIRTRKRKGFIPMDNLEERTSGTPMDPLMKMHARQILENLTTQLDERSMEIVVFHYIHGMDQSQIADCLGISRRAVVKRLTKLRDTAGHLWEQANNE